MGQIIERWLDKHLELNPDEIDISTEGWRRLGLPYEGDAAVPTGPIRDSMYSPGKYRVFDYPGSDASREMSETEIERKMTTVDARFIGPDGHRYDEVFHELRDPRVQARYNRMHRDARRIRRLGGLATAAAVGVVWALAHLPMPRLVSEDNCYNVVTGSEIAKPISSVRPAVRRQVLRHNQTCELGGRKYVALEPTKGRPKQHTGGPGVSDAHPAHAPHPHKKIQSRKK